MLCGSKIPFPSHPWKKHCLDTTVYNKERIENALPFGSLVKLVPNIDRWPVSAPIEIELNLNMIFGRDRVGEMMWEEINYDRTQDLSKATSVLYQLS